MSAFAPGLAARTQAPKLDGLAFDGKAGSLGAFFHCLLNPRIVEFRCDAARSANQKLAGMDRLGTGAADEGTLRLDAVNETLLQEEVERPVNRRRRRRPAAAAKASQNLIGADRLMASPDEFENAPSRFRQRQPAPGAELGSARNCIFHAGAVIMPPSRKSGPSAPPGFRLGYFYGLSHSQPAVYYECYIISYGTYVIL